MRFELQGREPPLTLRQDKQYTLPGHLVPVRQGLFPCSMVLKNSHRAEPAPQEFGLVLWPGVWRSTSVVQPRVLGFRVVAYLDIRSAPKGRQQMGETGFCEDLPFCAQILRKSAVSCHFLRKSATRKSLDLQSEPNISENLQKIYARPGSGFSPFAVSLLGRALTKL